MTELRDRYPHLKPYALVLLRGQERSGPCEVISFPWVDDGAVKVNVRLTPDDPTTMVCVSASEVLAMPGGNP